MGWRGSEVCLYICKRREICKKGREGQREQNEDRVSYIEPQKLVSWHHNHALCCVYAYMAAEFAALYILFLFLF